MPAANCLKLLGAPVWIRADGTPLALLPLRRFQLLARLQELRPVFFGLLLGLLLSAIVLSPGNARAFIYFQF